MNCRFNEPETYNAGKPYKTPLEADQSILQMVYSHEHSTVLMPIPYAGPEDFFSGWERKGKKTRFFFNSFQLFFDLHMGTHIGFREDYCDLYGKTYYKLNYQTGMWADLLNGAEIHWRPAITMSKEKIRKWFPIQRLAVIERKHIYGKIMYATNLYEDYQDLHKCSWLAVISLYNDNRSL